MPKPSSTPLRLTLVATAWTVALASACPDPCVSLAERICACQKDTFTRQSCRADRITSQSGTRTIEDSNRAACVAALETCDCTALDTNHTELCGFAPETPEE